MEDKQTNLYHADGDHQTVAEIALHSTECASVPETCCKKPGRVAVTLLLAVAFICLLILTGLLSMRCFGAFFRPSCNGICDVCGQKAIYSTDNVEYCKKHLDGIVEWYLTQKRNDVSTHYLD